MDIANRIQQLRKEKGISQEQLANDIGVSRQAVSKWESQQNLPDLDKVVTLSKYFQVSTDYLLMGKEDCNKQGANLTVSKILYIMSTAFILLGVFAAFSFWHTNQTAVDIFWGFTIEIVGIVLYYIGKVVSSYKAPFFIRWANTVFVACIPLSVIISMVYQGFPTPYPLGIVDTVVYIILYGSFIIISYKKLKKLPCPFKR